MDIKYELVLNGMTQEVAEDIYKHGYYIVQLTGNAYTLKEQYTCYAFNPSVIIPDVELVCPAEFMTPMKKRPIGIMIHMKQ